MKHYDKIFVDGTLAAENQDCIEVDTDLLCTTKPSESKIVGYGSEAAKGWEEWTNIVHVTNLNPAGEGSLADAVNLATPRTVIKFDVGGRIRVELGNPIVIRQRGVVIDGLSAPSPGITISVPEVRLQDNFKLVSGAVDVLIQGIRFDGAYRGGPFQGSNNQALPVIDGDSKPPATIRKIVFYRCTFTHCMDSAPDCWGRVRDVTFQECLWYYNRHPQSVSRPPDQGDGASVCKNDDGSLCHSDGITWYRNAYLENFERQPKIVSGDNLEYINNVVYGWKVPNPTEGGGAGLQINPKSGPYPFGSMNVINNAFIDSTGNPDLGFFYGDIPKGTPENNGSKARVWYGNGGLTSRIWCSGNILPENREFTKFNAATTPGAMNGPFVPAPYAKIPSVSNPEDLEQVIDGAGMPFPSHEELAVKQAAKFAYILVIK